MLGKQEAAREMDEGFVGRAVAVLHRRGGRTVTAALHPEAE